MTSLKPSRIVKIRRDLALRWMWRRPRLLAAATLACAYVQGWSFSLVLGALTASIGFTVIIYVVRFGGLFIDEFVKAIPLPWWAVPVLRFGPITLVVATVSISTFAFGWAATQIPHAIADGFKAAGITSVDLDLLQVTQLTFVLALVQVQFG